jgi:hypothetical protein
LLLPCFRSIKKPVPADFPSADRIMTVMDLAILHTSCPDKGVGGCGGNLSESTELAIPVLQLGICSCSPSSKMPPKIYVLAECSFIKVKKRMCRLLWIQVLENRD